MAAAEEEEKAEKKKKQKRIFLLRHSERLCFKLLIFRSRAGGNGGGEGGGRWVGEGEGKEYEWRERERERERERDRCTPIFFRLTLSGNGPLRLTYTRTVIFSPLSGCFPRFEIDTRNVISFLARKSV